MKCIKIPSLLILLLIITGFTALKAQSQLERISITERADGLGYVMRFHLSEMAASFWVAQSETDLIQMVLNSSELLREELTISELPGAFESVEYFILENSLAFDITVSDGVYFRAFAYPDVNRRDVLLAFEYTDLESVSQIAENRERIVWEQSLVNIPEPEPEEQEPAEPEDFEEPDQSAILSGWAVGIGLQAGFSSSNIYNVGYGRNSRSGYTVATTFDIQMPYRLPYNIRPGIETGIYFTQKGIENPESQKLNAVTVEFDYIEVPVLAKFSYDLLPVISPHIVLGPYVAFMINAERVRADESRRDLDNVTREIEFGGIAGIGIDIPVRYLVFTTQLRSSLGFTSVFQDEDFNDGEKHRFISVVFGLRF